MKRLKRVFSSGSQVIHLWANQSQTDARSANVFFNGPSVWSYGHHYELGRLHKIKGHTIAVINSRRYSVTTGKHQNWARQAVDHMLRLDSSDVSSIETGLKETQDRLVKNLMGHFSRRSFWGGHKIDEKDYLIQDVRRFNQICDVVKRKDLKLELDSDFIGLMNAHIKIALKRIADRDAFNLTPEAIALKVKQAEAASARALLKNAEEITAWRAGTGSLTNAVRALNPQLIRLRTRIADGSQDVETSRGATVPLTEALTLLNRIMKGKAVKGDKIGGFKVTDLTGSPDTGMTVKIGCHTISLSEAVKVLKEAA